MNALSRLVRLSHRRVAVLLGLACTGLVGASFYVQHVLGVEPCPLCIIQRFTYLALAIVFLGAALLPSEVALQRGLFGARRGADIGRFGRGGLSDATCNCPRPR